MGLSPILRGHSLGIVARGWYSSSLALSLEPLAGSAMSVDRHQSSFR